MAVNMKQVRAALEPEEPNYDKAAKLGADALPHLGRLVRGDDAMLASKAAYLAGLIDSDKSPAVLEQAAASDVPAVRESMKYKPFGSALSTLVITRRSDVAREPM